jgi:tetratricopeptide (TPR) repeat protein
LKWIAEQEPRAAEVSFLLAQAYEGSGERDEAISVLRQALAVEPRYFRAWISLAELLEKNRQFEEAAEAYGRAVAQSPKSIDLRLRQATALLNAGEAAAANALLDEVVKEAPTDGSALYLQTEAQRQMKDYDAAEATAKRLVALESDEMRGLFALALVYEARREHRKVIATLEPAASKAPSGPRSAPLHVRLGLAHQELGDFDRAIAAFEQARSASPGDPLFDAYLAQAYIAAGRPAEALDVTSVARKTRPEDFRFVRLEADALADSGKLDEAIALLKQEIARQSDRADVPLGLASLCVEHRRFDCAQSVLAAASERFPDNVFVTFQRGAMYERQEQFAEAERAFREALEREPDHGPTLNYLGYMLAERGEKLDEAVSLLEQALATDPYNGSYLDSLGWAHYVRGDLALARKYLGMAVERLPRNSVVLDHWGDLLLKTGERAEAIRAWERALGGDRDSIDPAAIERKLRDARQATR